MTSKKVSTAERLKEAMESAGKKQADLVRETKLDRGAISSYLSGKYEPKQNAINKLAIALDVSEMWLWGYDVPKERSAMQKKNDILADIVTAMRKDDEFMSLVEMLYTLDDDKRGSVKSLLSAFSANDK